MKHLSFAVAALAFASQSALAADPAKIDWSAVPATQVGLFYPGQSTYQWLRSKAHKGASKIKKGDAALLELMRPFNQHEAIAWEREISTAGGDVTAVEIWTMGADGSDPRPVVRNGSFNRAPSWGPSGELVFQSRITGATVSGANMQWLIVDGFGTSGNGSYTLTYTVQ